MQRYFFHLYQPGHFLKDEEGQLLPDADHAWEAAHATARGLMASDPQRSSEWLASRFEVTDHEGTLLLEVSFLEAVEPGAKRTRHAPNSGHALMQHMFCLGQAVRGTSDLSGRTGTSMYRVVQLLPPTDHVTPLYRVRSITDGVEWIVAEDRIVPAPPS